MLFYSTRKRPVPDSPFRYVEAPEPRLTVAPGASIIVDAESGYFIFQESAGDNRAAIVSASEARVLDQVVCYLVDGRKAGASATANRAVKMLVGSSLN